MAKKNKPPAPAPTPSKQDAPPAPAPVAAPVAAKPAVYVCVLTVKENDFKGKPGDEYKGDGLKDLARLQHLLKRGAIKAGE